MAPGRSPAPAASASGLYAARWQGPLDLSAPACVAPAEADGRSCAEAAGACAQASALLLLNADRWCSERLL